MERFERIYEDHREVVRAFVRRRAPESVVEDVVSETFLVCWRRLDRVPDEPLPWLYAVARKTLANQRRRLEREERLGAAPRRPGSQSRNRSGTPSSPRRSQPSRSAIGRCCGSVPGKGCRSTRRRSSSDARRSPAEFATTARRRDWRDAWKQQRTSHPT
jgi:hypothetical protein